MIGIPGEMMTKHTHTHTEADIQMRIERAQIAHIIMDPKIPDTSTYTQRERARDFYRYLEIAINC